jgi:phosphinothricin acetyltransferase
MSGPTQITDPSDALARAAGPDAASDAARAVVRDATEADMAAIQRIYEHYVLNSASSFEEVPPTTEQLMARREDVLRLGLPYILAEIDGTIVGYSYATAYRTRSAYRYTIENSVYVAQGMGGRGIGRLLLSALIDRCGDGRWRQMVAVIGNSENAASIALHRSLGFQPVGTLRNVGFKFGRWVDTVLMQRELGPGTGAPPTS